jgi:hypothetical protein
VLRGSSNACNCGRMKSAAYRYLGGKRQQIDQQRVFIAKFWLDRAICLLVIDRHLTIVVLEPRTTRASKMCWDKGVTYDWWRVRVLDFNGDTECSTKYTYTEQEDTPFRNPQTSVLYPALK